MEPSRKTLDSIWKKFQALRKWDAILAANPVLKGTTFKDRVKRWNALKAEADRQGMTNEEAVKFIAHGMQS